jgi:hypothetical protein
MVVRMSSTTEATSSAMELHAAAARLHSSLAAVDARYVDLREAVHLVGRALGELAALSESLCRDFTVSGSRPLPAPPPAPSELIRRSHEFTSSLCAARRNAELVCRYLPRDSSSSSPPRGGRELGGSVTAPAARVE